MKAHCQINDLARGYLEQAMEQKNFSARTLADLAGKENITSNEVLEAIQFRSLDRQLFE